jgi:hypothetical protein
MVDLLSSQSEDDDEMEDSMPPAEILRYQDPLDGMKSALQVAVERSQEETVWLLLWLASSLDSRSFPSPLVQVAQSIGAGRQTAVVGVDIRSLIDEEGRTVEEIAGAMGGTWSSLLQAGVLRA